VIELLPEDKHWWFASRTRALQALVDPAVRELGINGRVLDVGCGAGNMHHHLQHYGTVVGFDPFAGALDVAVDRGHRVVQADAATLPFADESFDFIAALDVVEHCQDDFRVLSEMHRTVRRGGLVAITVPAYNWLWSFNDVINHHFRRYTAGRLRERVEEAGLKVRRIGYNNFFVFPLAAAMIRLRGLSGPQLSAPSTDGAHQVEMQPASPPVNVVLGLVGRLEAELIRSMDLPFGVGLLCVAERP
jgi:SAM-dependent methyltransferase